jgi:hypothetical protein
VSTDPEAFDSLPDDIAGRLQQAIERSPDAAKARRWLESERPQQLRDLTQRIAASYAEVENSSPAAGVIGSIVIDALEARDVLRLTWPDPSLVTRELMFRATHLYRTLGLLVAEAGSDVTSSLQVIGRAMLEALSHVYWILEPLRWADRGNSARAVARRTYLLSLARLAELGFEAEDFEMPDISKINDELATGRERAAGLFGSEAVSLSRRNPSNWRIDDEGLPRKSELVDRVGKAIFSLGVRKASHYRTPSLAAHASLAAPLGRFIPIDGPDNVHVMFCIDADIVERWLWYYTVWYRYTTGLMAHAHHWPHEQLTTCDAEAKRMFGQSVFVEASELNKQARASTEP